MSITIRIGLGQTKSGKILDRDTQWYHISKATNGKMAAIKRHDETNKPIFISVNGRAYRKITREQLVNLK